MLLITSAKLTMELITRAHETSLLPSDPNPPVKCVSLWWKQTAEHAGGPVPGRTAAGRRVGTGSSSLPELGADGFAVSSSPWVSLQLLSP